MSRSVKEWIDQLDEAGELRRIDAEVHWDQEMSAITYTAHKEKGAPTLLFENITDYPGHRVLFNMFSGSARRLALMMNVDPSSSVTELVQAARTKFDNRIEPERVDSENAPIFENTDEGDDVDLTKFPAPKMWPKDGGRYLGTADATVSRDPDTGNLNVATYRQMIHSENETGLYTSPGKDLRLQMERCWERGEPLPVAAAYGVQPELYLAGGLSFSKSESEYGYAGGMRGSPIEVVDGPVTDLPIPAHAEIVVEGYLHPHDEASEGPFGEFTGYYGRPEGDAPVFSVDAVHHRDDPILTCALMADYPGNDINLAYSVGRSAGVWNDLDKLGIPGIEGVYCHPAAAGGFAMTVVSVDQQHAGHVSQVASVAAQCPSAAYYSKIIVAVDEDVDPTDMDQVLWALATRFAPERDIDMLTDTWSTYLDPARFPNEERPYGAKLLLDATIPHRHYDEFSERNAVAAEVYERVTERWDDLGFEGDPAELPLLADVTEENAPTTTNASDADDEGAYSM